MKQQHFDAVEEQIEIAAERILDLAARVEALTEQQRIKYRYLFQRIPITLMILERCSLWRPPSFCTLCKRSLSKIVVIAFL
jgi:hypothetical protein